MFNQKHCKQHPELTGGITFFDDNLTAAFFFPFLFSFVVFNLMLQLCLPSFDCVDFFVSCAFHSCLEWGSQP